MPEIITRAEAKARGLKRYFVGLICHAGHVSERYVINSGCCVCADDAKKRYALSHPDKVKETARISARKRRSQNPEKYRTAFRIYKENFIKEHGVEEFRKIGRKSYQKNREKRLAELRKYRAENKDYFRRKYSEARERDRKVADLVAVLKEEMPDLLKEFGL
jgi:hypothetical protein